MYATCKHFVHFYNEKRKHSSIGKVMPAVRSRSPTRHAPAIERSIVGGYLFFEHLLMTDHLRLSQIAIRNGIPRERAQRQPGTGAALRTRGARRRRRSPRSPATASRDKSGYSGAPDPEALRGGTPNIHYKCSLSAHAERSERADVAQGIHSRSMSRCGQRAR